MSINYFKILQPGGGGFSKSYRTKSCGLLFFTPAAFSVDLFDFELLLLLLMENSSKASKAKPAAEIRCWIEAKSWRVVEVVDVVVVVVVDVVLSSSSSTWCCHRRCRCCYWCIKNHFQIAKDDFSFRSIFNFPSPKKKKLNKEFQLKAVVHRLLNFGAESRNIFLSQLVSVDRVTTDKLDQTLKQQTLAS